MDELVEKPEIRIGTAGIANYIAFRPDVKKYSDPIAKMVRDFSPVVSDRLLVDNDGTQYRELGYRIAEGKSAHHIGNIALCAVLGLDDVRSVPRYISFSDDDVKDMSKGARLF